VEADKKRDRDRKEAARRPSAPLALPPALPSALENGNGAVQAPPGGPAPGVPGPDLQAAPVIPWNPDTLRPLFEELVDAAEEGRVEKFRTVAAQGGLPEGLVKEIAGDAKYSPVMKRTICSTAPNVMAKTMNRLGVSGEYSDEAILATALTANLIQSRRLMAKLENLIEEAKAAKAAADKGTKA